MCSVDRLQNACDYARGKAATPVAVPRCSVYDSVSSLDAYVLELLERNADRERAFYIADLRCVYEKYRLFTKCLPRVRPHYAVKCNPAPEIIGLLASLGCGFDCASADEVEMVLSETDWDAADTEANIIFANPCKLPTHLVRAAEKNVRRMTFDSIAEIDKMAKHFPTAELVLRIITDDTESRCPFSAKFGAHLDAVPSLIQHCIRRNMTLVGVSFHVGSGCGNASAFVDAVESARRVFDVARAMGVETMTLLDVGGGFPGSNDCSPTFAEIAKTLTNALDTHFPAADGYELIAEPGRYFVSESHVLVANIFGRRTVSSADGDAGNGVDVGGSQRSTRGEMLRDRCVSDSSLTTDSEAESVDGADDEDVAPNSVHLAGESDASYLYFLNEGVYHSFSCMLFDHYSPTPIPIMNVKERGMSRTSDRTWVIADSWEEDDHVVAKQTKIFGPTCDALDCIAEDIRFPVMRMGEWMMFRNMGAYTIASATAFNGFDAAERLFVWTDC